jgi:hypothetical protein
VVDAGRGGKSSNWRGSWAVAADGARSQDATRAEATQRRAGDGGYDEQGGTMAKLRGEDEL